jgi:perosamine synthetase
VQAFEQLEESFGRWAGVENVVGCASGSSALLLGLEALRLPQGSEVICPTFTMISCARAISLAGLTPVFVDCGPDLNLDVNRVAREVYRPGSGVRAVMAVHIYGRRANLDSLHSICGLPNPSGRKVLVVEDLAEAHGVPPHPYSEASCYSFYRNKIICCPDGEGGAVSFRLRSHAELARSLRCLGFGAAPHNFIHQPRGWNHRLSNAHAELILSSLANVRANLARRREAERWYDAACPPEWRMPARDVPWVYDVRVPGMTWDDQYAVVLALHAEGIQARCAFKPMHCQEEYRDCRRVGGEVAERMSAECFYLPLTPGAVTEATARLAFDVIRRALGG